jgi:hypothetical protein
MVMVGVTNGLVSLLNFEGDADVVVDPSGWYVDGSFVPAARVGCSSGWKS